MAKLIAFLIVVIAVIAVGAFMVLQPPEPPPGQPAAAPIAEFAATGRVVVERQANVFTYNRQQDPSLDIDRDGNVLVVWGSRRQEANTFGVYGRLFDASGEIVGGEIHVNETMPSSQDLPAVACAGDGTAWVAWQSLGQDGAHQGIVARRFGIVENVFTALTGEIVVNAVTARDQIQPAVAVSGDRTLFAWTTVVDERQVVAARLYAADGTPATDEFRLTDTTDLHEWLPAVAAQDGGHFVLAWASRAADGIPVGVFHRRVAADGSFGSEVQLVAAPGERHDVEPSIDADGAGRYVIGWMGLAPGGGYDVYTRRFAADGTPLGPPQVVAALADRPAGAWQSGVAVATAPDGRYAVAYNLDTDTTSDEGHVETTTDIHARRFAADGTADGAEFRVNEQQDGKQSLNVGSNARRVAWRHGRLAFAWHGKVGEDGNGVGVTILRPDESPPGKTADP